MKPEQFFNDFYTIKPSKSEKVEVEALEPIICEYFRYASWEEKQKIEEEMNKMYAQFEEDPELDIDSSSDDLLK